MSFFMKLTSYNLLQSPSKGKSPGIREESRYSSAPGAGMLPEITCRKTAVSGGIFAPQESDRLFGF
jgi:hypothetical protein